VKYRVLVAVPFVAVALLWLALALTPIASRAALYKFEVELAKSFAFAGCAVAAFAFRRGDYLRRAWLLLGTCYVLILLNDVFFCAGLGAMADRPWAPATSGIVVAIANAAQLVGTVMIARTWRVAGFELAGSQTQQRLVLFGVIAISIAAGGWLVFTSARDLLHGTTGAAVDLFSSIADIISFSLLAPFLLTAVALRGGTLAWTWTLLTVSNFAWLLFDATLSFGPAIFASAATVKAVEEMFRLGACTFGFSAGVAQRIAITSVRD
jgi:hypothetical protein